ncbi:hypothetical protein EYF80_057957 [Liparis tanakae]|uniref:Uncharacterized protein n=1 Tax=Liparis tanakae TaxID=230148 RepID=A0A4Z2EU32_9TELE|nr:hypothetical protein EYF80_057957 [Liparis tanakae]
MACVPLGLVYLPSILLTQPWLTRSWRPNPLVGEFHYSLADHVREGPAVYKHASKLVHPAVSWRSEREREREDMSKQGQG